MHIGILTYDDEWAGEVIHGVSKVLSDAKIEVIGISEVELCAPLKYDIILDRQSYLEPYLRCAMKHAALHGTYVINNPFSCSLDDKFFFYGIARTLNLKIPKTLLLPPQDPDYEFGHVIPQLSTDWIRSQISFPAVLKPVNGYAWRNVFFVNNMDELITAYNKTGNETMILQEKVNYDEYVRAFVVGKKHVLPVKYIPEERKYIHSPNFLDDAKQREITDICRKLNEVLDYDINTVEIGLCNGDPYLIDFSNYVPEIRTYNLPPECYDWVVMRIIDLIVEYAKEMPHKKNRIPFFLGK